MQAMERFMNHGSIVSDSLLHSATEGAGWQSVPLKLP